MVKGEVALRWREWGSRRCSRGLFDQLWERPYVLFPCDQCSRLTSETAFELVKVRRQLEYSIAAAKGIHIVKPPTTWEAVKDIVRGPTGGMGNPNNSPKGITALWTGMRLHLCKQIILISD